MHWEDLDKTQRRALGRLVVLAYERELSEVLGELDAQFARWRTGEIGAAELNDLIHDHHLGPSRTLWKKYFYPLANFAVRLALTEGVLTDEDLPEDLREIIVAFETED